MRATLGAIAVATFFASGLACESADSGTGTLSVGDVTRQPPGNAVGTSLTGTYVIESSTLLGCDCRIGSCSDIRATRGGRLVLTQQDGVLQIEEENAQPTAVVYVGGVDRDGKFRAGTMLVTDSFTWLSLMQGTVVASVALDARTRFTVTGEVDGTTLDCDGEVEIHAPFWAE